MRADILYAAFDRNPGRFVRKPPEPPKLPAAAWINKPTEPAPAETAIPTQR
jgi:putative transposase